jgi:hypothetical protein
MEQDNNFIFHITLNLGSEMVKKIKKNENICKKLTS